jgi:hypothetical protein
MTRSRHGSAAAGFERAMAGRLLFAHAFRDGDSKRGVYRAAGNDGSEAAV